jgi:hypothetical protein
MSEELQIIECEQGTEEWYRARAGIPTASEFHTILMKGKGAAPSVTRRKYLYRLAGEILTGEPEERYSNGHMERGREMEPQVRELYSFAWADGAECRQVGFVRCGKKGASPDLLVGSDGMAEFKTNLPSILIERILNDEVPAEHVAQLQGGLWVAKREWIDIVCYWPKMPAPHIKRVYRDEAYIAQLAAAVDQFNAELEGIVAAIRAKAA